MQLGSEFARAGEYDCYNWQDIEKLDLSLKRLITDMMKDWQTSVAKRADQKVIGYH